MLVNHSAMFGTIHNALKMACTKAMGEDVWMEIEKAAEVDVSAQFRMDNYPDTDFERLLAAAVDHSGRSRDELLEHAGRAFAASFQEVGTRDMIAGWGDTLPAFLDDFDNKYRRVHDLHPKMKVPSLVLKQSDEHGLQVAYKSPREGLQPFVGGILAGLGEQFGTPVRIVHEEGLIHINYL